MIISTAIAWLVSTACAQPRPPPLYNFDYLMDCRRNEGSNCSTADYYRLPPVGGFGFWYFRRELAQGIVAQASSPVRRSLLEEDCRRRFNYQRTCIALHMLTDDPTQPSEWSRRACEIGDAGSCLLTSLTDPTALGAQCESGAANACAWRLEVLRLRDEPVPVDALADAQNACIHQAEPVACAAAGKYFATHPSSADAFHGRACQLGYEPSCDAEARDTRGLAEEAAPSILGPSFLRPGGIQPLPGRPGVPGYWGQPLGR